MRVPSTTLTIALAAALLGCGGSKTSTVSVSSAVSSNSPSVTATASSLSATVRFDNLYLVVKEFELRKASTGGPTGSTGPSGPSGVSGPTGTTGPSTHDREELEAGPYVIEVAVGATGLQAAIPTTVVPPGSYSGVEFEIHRVRSTEKLNLQATKGGTKLDGLSIVLEGTCTGPAAGSPPVTPAPAKFAVTSSMEVEVEYETPFTVADGASTNVTLAFDASRWLAGPDGTTLDPCLNDPVVNYRIMQNVKASLRAFGDKDRDGKED